jgi:capsule polysaccharide export protein KpsC/LpsZ
MDYWISTKSSPNMLMRRVYESPEAEAHLRLHPDVCPAAFAADLGTNAQNVRAYQRRLGLRPLTGNPGRAA